MNEQFSEDCVHDWREVTHRPKTLDDLRVVFYCTKCGLFSAASIPDDILKAYEIEGAEEEDEELINAIDSELDAI